MHLNFSKITSFFLENRHFFFLIFEITITEEPGVNEKHSKKTFKNLSK